MLKPNRFFLPCCFAAMLGSPLAGQPIGINLSMYADYTQEFVFKDAFKSCREWITFDPTNFGVWDTGLEVPATDEGYPLEVPFSVGGSAPQMVRTLLLWNLPNGYPPGNYTVLSEGTGMFRIRQDVPGASWQNFNSPANGQFQADGQNGIILELRQSSVGDPVHNIRFVMPELDEDFQDEPFHPALIDFLQPFECIRWMDLMRTNDSPVVEWSDRTSTSFYSQAQASGIAYEYLARLCNDLEADAWVNIPHAASNDFVEQFAIFLRDNLDAERRIYVEYSNEVWNGIFDQHDHAIEQGTALGYVGQLWEIGWQYTAHRSAEVFHIFNMVFESDLDRLVRVIPSQASTPFISDYILDRFENAIWNPLGVTADALAIGPYFGGAIADQIGNAGIIESITVDEILDMAEASLPTSFNWITEQLGIALEHGGLALLAYEGGQHLVSFTPAFNNNQTLTDKLNEANRQSRMGEFYCQYFNFWYDNGGGLFMHYNSHSAYNQYGSWGLKEYLGQPAEDAPKYQALVDCHIILDAEETQPGSPTQSLFEIAPQPSGGIFYIHSLAGIQAESAEVFDLQGRRLLTAAGFPQALDLSALPDGTYFLLLKTESNLIERHLLVKQ